MIADISGFTDLVYTTDLVAGANIMKRLLWTIIEANTLNLKIAEIEGDAVFFYKFGAPPTRCQVLYQYEMMLQKFHEAIHEIPELSGRKIPLSLKMVVHYGDVTQYHVGGFDRLYGKVVTEAHMLLKNSVKSHTYVLMTDQYLRSLDAVELLAPDLINSQCEVYNGLKRLCYSSVDYS